MAYTEKKHKEYVSRNCWHSIIQEVMSIILQGLVPMQSLTRVYRVCQVSRREQITNVQDRVHKCIAFWEAESKVPSSILNVSKWAISYNC